MPSFSRWLPASRAVQLAFASIAIVASPAEPAAAGSRTLMRFPTSSAKSVAFVAHGGLWIAPLAGGSARLLVRDAGDVAAPRFSPDARWIAFTWRRGNGRDVYVVSTAGGEPRRLTFDAAVRDVDDLVVGWTPDSSRIVFLSTLSSPLVGMVRAFTVQVQGGPAESLPLERAGMLSYSPDGKAVAYDRSFRNFDLPKRYTGGRAGEIYIYDFAKTRMTRVTDWKGTDTAPMWYGKTIYFLSDRGPGFRANIWAYDTSSRRFRQVTHFGNFDVDWPSLGEDAITFQQGGRLWALALPSERLRAVKIDVPDDKSRTSPREVGIVGALRASDAQGGIDYASADDGSLIVSARGDLLRIADGGHSVDLDRSPGSDEDGPAPSPDGRRLAYTTDAGGERQVAVRSLVGAPRAMLLTRFSEGRPFTPIWSPLGDSLAVADANHRLWLVRVDGSGSALVATDPHAAIRDASFSPDGHWLAYSTQRSTMMRAIHLRELATGRDVIVSSPNESDRNPVFTNDGRLVFISKRNEQPFVSDRGDQSLIATLNSDGLYAATLAAPRSVDQAVVTRGYDLDGLMGRAVPLPATPAVIATLEIRGSELFYETQPPQLIDGALAGEVGALHALSLSTGSDRIVVRDLQGHALSPGGGFVAFRRGAEWRVARTRFGDTAERHVDLDSVRVPVQPRREWSAMLDEAWRLDRDVFFSRVMNGTDWPAVRTAYRGLAPLIGSQADFLYVLGQMQGELASSHTFVKRGDDEDSRAREAAPRLGVDLRFDSASGGYQIKKIYSGDATRPALRSPLGTPGLAKVGDVLIGVNGRKVTAVIPPAALLAGQRGLISLTFAGASGTPAHTIAVEPVADESAIRRLDWIARQRETVAALSGGHLGYLYLSDFDAEGSREFVRQYYPQLDRDGLVVDVRWNRGGFTSQAVLETLRRERAGVFVNREGALEPLPTAAAPRAMVTLLNQASSSDGDQFPYFFRKAGLGPLIGTRSWGGVQGIDAPWQLADGTMLTIPKDSLAGLDGRWVIENAGVDPDVVVDTVPGDTLADGDPQLEAAVAAGMEELRRHPPARPTAPPALPGYPDLGDVPGASFGNRKAASDR